MQAALKGTISLGGREKSKDRKTRKSRSKERAMDFSSDSLFPRRKQDAFTQGGTIEPGDRTPEAEENPGSRYWQRLGRQVRPRVHSRYINVKQE